MTSLPLWPVAEHLLDRRDRADQHAVRMQAPLGWPVVPEV
jgi:hypothetical protein